MYPVKQSTALTVPVYIHDVNGDAVLGLVDGGFTKRISKGSGAFGAMTVTITEKENGWYDVPISASHSDTLGLLTITLLHGSAKQVNLQFRVEANLNDDISTALAVVDGIVDTILIDTNELQTDWTDGGRLDLILDDVLLDTGTTMPATLSTIDGNVDAILLDTGTDGVVISSVTAAAIADALLNRDMSAVSDTNARTPLNALRILRNKYSVAGTTLTVTKEDDSTSAWTSVVTTDAAAEPITGSDPT